MRLGDGEDQPDVALAVHQLDMARADLAQDEGGLAKGRVLAPQAELEVYQADIAHVA